MFERPGRLADRFPNPFPNDSAARVSNNGAVPPDLSLMAKARTYERGFPWFVIDIFTQFQQQGVDYIVALMKGYENAPQGVELPPGSNYNKYFPGHAINMPKPLEDGRVEYTDGTPGTLQNYAKDVAAFLAWTAEPHMEARKRIGMQVMIFLIIFAGLLYFVKKKVWAGVPEHA
jgi:ubiquinol-cytochrome c reductase cytochrome b/c1 subunit